MCIRDSDSAAARKFVDACKELCDICGIPSVSGYGIDLVAVSYTHLDVYKRQNQYKAKGPLTSLLLSVVALDDAVALIGFGFASTIVTCLLYTSRCV